MIKRLNMFASQAQKDLRLALIDKTHQKIKFSFVRKVFRSFTQSQTYATSLFEVIKKNFKSSNNQLKIKSLILLHYFTRKSNFKNSKILSFAESQLNAIKSKFNKISSKSKINIQNQQKEYIQKNIIQFYVLYLLKYIMHQQSYVYCKQVSDQKAISQNKKQKSEQKHCQPTCQTKPTSQTKPRCQSKSQSCVQSILQQQISHGFQIINLITFILQSQQSFNKMGRYYIEQDQILNLFIMYLDDLTLFNDLIKRMVKKITRNISQFAEQQVKHCFLFLTEAQKISDRLYEFYYNRYYYVRVKKMICMPTFLTVQVQDFQRVVKEIKRVDKQLFLVVKDSKYSKEYIHNKTMPNITQYSDQSRDKRRNYSKMNRTMMTQQSGQRSSFHNISSCDSRNKQFKQIEQNLTKYIEQFHDITDDFI